MNFKSKLYNIMKDVSKFKGHTNALERGVVNKLDISLNNYKHNLVNTCSYLMTRSGYKVLKYYSKEDKIDE